MHASAPQHSRSTLDLTMQDSLCQVPFSKPGIRDLHLTAILSADADGTLFAGEDGTPFAGNARKGSLGGSGLTANAWERSSMGFF